MTSHNKLMLRLEGGIVALLALWLYNQTGHSWWLFAALILVPDISMLGYLKDTKTGALIYNIGHTYIAPAIFWLIASALSLTFANSVALIWIAHIGFDRLLGYGLKYPDDFKHTHLS
jgi:hypothetical protein